MKTDIDYDLRLLLELVPALEAVLRAEPSRANAIISLGHTPMDLYQLDVFAAGIFKVTFEHTDLYTQSFAENGGEERLADAQRVQRHSSTAVVTALVVDALRAHLSYKAPATSNA